MEFSRPEYWSGLPFPSPGYLPDPRIEPLFPALQVDSLPSEPPGKLSCFYECTLKRAQGPCTGTTLRDAIGGEEKAMATHSSTLAWKNPMDGGAWQAAVHEVAKSRMLLSDFPFTFLFHSLEKEMATHSSVLAWRIPGTVEPGGLPSLGWHRVGHDWSDPEGWDWGSGGRGGSGWGTHVHPWLIHVNVPQKPLQYCKVVSLQLK